MPIKQIMEQSVLVSTDFRPNETRALAALFRAGALSRAALARDLGLTRSTTGALVLGLTEAGLARERSDGADDEQDGEGRVGRPGILVEIEGNGGFFLGAYIGVNWIVVVASILPARVRAGASQGICRRGQHACKPRSPSSRNLCRRDRSAVACGHAPLRAQRRGAGLPRRRWRLIPCHHPWLARGQSGGAFGQAFDDGFSDPAWKTMPMPSR